MGDALRMSAMALAMMNIASPQETYWPSHRIHAANDLTSPSKRKHRDKVKAARKQKHRSKK